jgi:hypothetical protein
METKRLRVGAVMDHDARDVRNASKKQTSRSRGVVLGLFVRSLNS